MTTKRVEEERIRLLNDKEPREGDHVLYWTQQAQRADYDHALKFGKEASLIVRDASSLGTRR